MRQKRQNKHPEQKGKKSKKGLFLRSLTMICAIGLLAAGGVYGYEKTHHPKQSVVKAVMNDIGKQISGQTEPVNILLIANNARDAANPLSLGTGGGQADILIVAHIDPTTHSVSLISVPRDTLFAMPNYEVDIPKIKTTFTVGLNQSPQQGPILAMNAVSQMLGLPIHDYIVTDFQGFADAINAVGGIQVNVKQRIYDPEHSGADLKPGLQTLNGDQALAFVRVRQNAAGNDYRVNDFQRQDAEMQVLDILKQKLLDSITSPSQMQKLVNVWQKDVVTNMSTSELVGLGMQTAGTDLQKINLGSVKDSMDLAGAPAPGFNKENYITGAYYDVLDPQEVTKSLAPLGSTGANMGLPPIPAPSQIPVQVYGSQVVVDELKKAGYPVTYMGPSSNPSQPSVYYPPGHMEWGWSLARTLGTANEWVAPQKNPTDSVIVDIP